MIYTISKGGVFISTVNKQVLDPSGRIVYIIADDYDGVMKKITKVLDKWQPYCERNWLNDSGEIYSPEAKVKRMLDSLAYCLLVGHLDGIETEYKKVMHAKREIPESCCPKEVENIFYASGTTSDNISIEEQSAFKILLDMLDERAKIYDVKKYRHNKPRKESMFHKRNRLGIHNGTWCRVDTDGVFEYNGRRYKIDENEIQYQPIETDYGDLYDMDRILACDGKFYDMNYDEVKVLTY